MCVCVCVCACVLFETHTRIQQICYINSNILLKLKCYFDNLKSNQYKPLGPYPLETECALATQGK